MTTFASSFSKIAWTRVLTLCAMALAAGSPVLTTVHAAPAPAASAAAAAAAGSFDASDVGNLRPHLNEKVEVHGTPTVSGTNKPGNIGYLNFAGAHKAVALVFFLKSGEPGKAGSVDDLKPFVGKPIVVTGTLTEFKGDLQIVVESLDQIKAAP